MTSARRSSLAVAVSSLLLLVAGCAAPAPAPTPTPTPTPHATMPTGAAGTLTGTGTTAATDMVGDWAGLLQSSNPGATVDYQSAPSPAARARFVSGAAQFLLSDETFTTAELSEYRFAGCAAPAAEGSPAALVQVPVSISPIAVVFRLDGVPTLSLDAAAIAGIFAGEITEWDDPAIAADNPHATLPHRAIVPFHLAGSSSLTKNFTDYMSANTDAVWAAGAVDQWPSSKGRTVATSEEVAGAVTQTEGSIGYAYLRDAGTASVAMLWSGAAYASPTAAGAQRAVAEATVQPNRSATETVLDLERRTIQNRVYPLVAVTYLIGCESYADPQASMLAEGLFFSAVSAPATTESVIPLPASLRERAQEAVDAAHW